MLACIALAIALARSGLGLGADFEIRRRRGGRLTIRGRIARSKAAAIRGFFGDDLAGAGPIVVRGSLDHQGRAPRLRISGRLSPGDRQRIRNFLLEHLR